jgi:hypothetical protein
MQERASAVGIVTRTVRGLDSGRCQGILPFLKGADRLWGSHNLLFNGYRRPFPTVKWTGRGVNLSPACSAELRMGRELFLFPLYAVMALARRTLTLRV